MIMDGTRNEFLNSLRLVQQIYAHSLNITHIKLNRGRRWTRERWHSGWLVLQTYSKLHHIHKWWPLSFLSYHYRMHPSAMDRAYLFLLYPFLLLICTILQPREQSTHDDRTAPCSLNSSALHSWISIAFLLPLLVPETTIVRSNPAVKLISWSICQYFYRLIP